MSLVSSLSIKRILNISIAFVVVGLVFLYISRGWSVYQWLPGGPNGLMALAFLTLTILVGTRIYYAYNQQAWQAIWRNSRILEVLPISLIVVAALVVRLWGINFGLPYLEHVDEWNVAERALHMVGTGNFDPHDYHHPGLADDDRQAFTYPTFYTYLQTAVMCLRFLQGVGAGKYDGTNVLTDILTKADFYLWGRALTALLGAGTVLLVYVIGRRAYNRQVGLVASLFLSFFYLHALNSHWITTDVPSGFMVLLPFLVILPILEGHHSPRLYFLAGLLAGLAIATKYNNALVFLPIVAAHVLGRTTKGWRNWSLVLAAASTLLGFAIGAPFIFGHLPQFLSDLAAIVNHYQNLGHAGFEADNNWWQYLTFMSAENLVVLVLALGGLLLAVARHLRQDVILLIFPLLTYLQLSSYKVNFSRNLMPMLPFLAIFAALFLVISLQWLFASLKLNNSWQVWLLSGLAILAILSPALAIARYDWYNALPTNRAKATAWIEQNLPHGAKLWLEPFSTDLVSRNAYRLEGGKGALTYPPEWYAANGFHYLVLSEAYYKEALTSGNPVVQASYKSLTEGPYPAGMTLVQDFKKTSDQPGATIIILKTTLPLLVTPSQIGQKVAYDFNNSIRLAGFDLPSTVRSGTVVPIALYWQTLRRPDANYTTFIHLLDANNQKVAQLDLPPFAGTRPAQTWQAGELVRDDYPLTLPTNLAAGMYRLAIGLYVPDGARLKLGDGQDQAIVGTLKVTK